MIYGWTKAQEQLPKIVEAGAGRKDLLPAETAPGQVAEVEGHLRMMRPWCGLKLPDLPSGFP